MLVWEKINELAGKNVSRKLMAEMALQARMCPIAISNSKEFSKVQSNEVYILDKIAVKICHERCNNPGCGKGCLDNFLDSEWKDGE